MKLIPTNSRFYNNNTHPFAPFFNLQRELDRWFDASEAATNTPTPTFTPSLEVRETPENIIIALDLPGIDRKEVTVALENDVLTIRGERKVESTKEGENTLRSERFYGRFERNLGLPKGVEASKVSATFKEGVLTVTLPKVSEAKPRQIEVQ